MAIYKNSRYDATGSQPHSIKHDQKVYALAL